MTGFIGLIWRVNYVRVLKSVFDSVDGKNYLLSRMNAATGNIKPVIVINDTTKETVCYLINDNMDGFVIKTGLEASMFCLRVKRLADWQINKAKTQKFSISPDEKEKICRTLEHRDLKRSEITLLDKSEMGKGLRDSSNKTKYKKALSDLSLSASETDIKPEPTEEELQNLSKLGKLQFVLSILAMQKKYPVYADEIMWKLRRRNITFKKSLLERLKKSAGSS